MNCKFNKIITNRLFFSIGIGTSKNLIKLMMRTFIFLFSMALFSLAPKHAFSQNEKIVIDADKDVTIEEIIEIIGKQTDYILIYHGDLFKDTPKIPLKKGKIRLNTLLNQSLATGDVQVTFSKGNTILLQDISGSQSQQITVTGTVTDQAGLPIPGATVLIKGTTKGTATDLDGHYTISVPDPANVLVFSSLGFERKEIMVGSHLPAGQAGTTINVSLKEDISALDEVVIKGYYKTTKKYDTGSVGSIKAETIEKQPVSNPIAAMQGYIPGVNITKDSGMPGSGFSIEIRGKNFIGASNITQPLYIVDGVPYSSQSFGNLGDVDSFS